MGTNSLPPELLNTVHCMDCLELMRTLPDGCIDLVLTDPPYGLGKKLSQGGGKHKNSRMRKDYEGGPQRDEKPTHEYFDELFRVSKSQIIRGGNYFDLPATRCFLVWDKLQYMPTFSMCEYARTSFDKPAKIYQQRTTDEEVLREHPTQKTVGLFRRILENYSEQGMTILDCFAGSGTTGVACKELGRNYILVEKEPKYCDIIHKRLQNTTVSLFHS